MDELSDRVVYVGNVAAEIDEPSLLAIFSNCGPVTEIRLAGQVSVGAQSALPLYVVSMLAGEGSLEARKLL